MCGEREIVVGSLNARLVGLNVRICGEGSVDVKLNFLTIFCLRTILVGSSILLCAPTIDYLSTYSCVRWFTAILN